MTILDQHVWRQSTSAVPPPQQRQGGSLTPFHLQPPLHLHSISPPFFFVFKLALESFTCTEDGSCIATETSVHSKKKLSSQVAQVMPWKCPYLVHIQGMPNWDISQSIGHALNMNQVCIVIIVHFPRVPSLCTSFLLFNLTIVKLNKPRTVVRSKLLYNTIFIAAQIQGYTTIYHHSSSSCTQAYITVH